MASLYRTYRPRGFDEVVGQEHVVRTLRNAIESGRVAHAYLFAGPRGTGKTSLAKILAKALNAEGGPSADFDPSSERSRRIADATSLDVIELDAASHRGIDDIREIRERVELAPVEGQYKVYILDEAHSLTTDASNALLKTLEEPPPHVVFVLCTTDPAKLLPTIRSRCQRFTFARPGPGELVRDLRRVADAEGIEAPDAALHLIARAASGSFRDALTTLDQLATSCDKRIGTDDTVRLLGLVPEQALSELVDLIAAQDAGGALRRLDALAEGGQALDGLLTALLDHLRLLYLLQHANELPASEQPAPDRLEELRRQARALPPGETLRAVGLLAEALTQIREGSDPRLPLEVAIVRAARPQADRGVEALLGRIERLEAQLAAGSPTPPPAPPSTQPQAPPPAPREAVPTVSAAGPPPAEPTPEPVAAGGDIATLRAAWNDVLARLDGPAVGVYGGSRPTELDGTQLTVEVARAALLPSAPRYAEALAHAVAATCAMRVEPRAVAASGPAGPVERPAEGDAQPSELLDSQVGRLVETFEAEVVEP